MPINIPDGLPAKRILQQERIFALEEDVASKQQIRPLCIALLNLMPTKIETETQIRPPDFEVTHPGECRLHARLEP